ncbi:MAG: YbeD family protein [Candidatus Berkiella sp.]
MQEGKSIPLSFPCEFIFKIIGESKVEFEGEVFAIIRKHFPLLGEGAIRLNNSKNAKYLSLTVTVQASSQEQLDAAYQDLSHNPLVLFVL